MRVESAEWSLGKSPKGIIEAWSVAAMVEAILVVLMEENRGMVAAILSRGIGK